MTLALPQSLENALLAAGVSAAAIQAACDKAGAEGDVGAQLEAAGVLAQKRWARLLADCLGVPFAETVATEGVSSELLQRVGMQYCRRNRVLPLEVDGTRVLVATADPLHGDALGDLRVIYGCEVDPIVVPAAALTVGINRAFDAATNMSARLGADLGSEMSLEAQAAELTDAPDLLDADDEAPIIRLVNTIIFQAAKDGASDIHIEPFERTTSIRFRVDGMLLEVLTPPRRVHAALASRVKVMADMNIAERRLPQDGGIRTRVAGRELDIRVSTVPTAFGERVVMRLLDRSTTLLGLEEIGFGGDNLTNIRRLIRQSHGIVLVTGPTGSGKTTTLYAALSEINSVDKNIITIEDPIEYQLRGIGQIQVNAKIDLSFANGLRSILRQDPDVIMVGEIRDADTARIAIQAALTGHLVFSTLHTNDSFSAITRLLDMGIEPFLVSSSVIGIIAQRLVRRLCTKCRTPLGAGDPDLRELELSAKEAAGAFQPGAGCEACRHSGYRGRTAISELLLMDDRVRTRVMQRADATTIRDDAAARGMRTLRADGAGKIVAGITSIAEVVRTTADDPD